MIGSHGFLYSTRYVAVSSSDFGAQSSPCSVFFPFFPQTDEDLVQESLAPRRLQTKGDSLSSPAGISQSTSALCQQQQQQQQFRRLSPHPSAGPPEYLSVFPLRGGQVLRLLRAPVLRNRSFQRWILYCLCEGLLREEKYCGGKSYWPRLGEHMKGIVRHFSP